MVWFLPGELECHLTLGGSYRMVTPGFTDPADGRGSVASSLITDVLDKGNCGH